MPLKIKAMLWLGGVFAAFTAAVVLAPASGRGLWGPIVLSSTMFAFLAVAFGSARWALIAIPGFVLAVAGFTYGWLHRGEPIGLVVLVATVAVNLLIVWLRTRKHGDMQHA